MAFWDKWFKKKPKAANTKPLVAAAGKPQTRDYYDNLFMQFGGYIKIKGSLDVYDMIRELLPICDVAPIKRARLVGDFRLDGLGNKRVQDALDSFYRNVRVGFNARGWRSAQGQILDSVYSKGFSVLEIVADESLRNFSRLKVVRANDFRFRKNKAGEMELVQVLADTVVPIVLEKQDLIKYVAFDLRDGHPQGVSMFSSIPFLAQILVRIQCAVDNMIWRVGDPTMVGFYTPGDQETPDDARAMAEMYQQNITTAMETRRNGGVSDLCFTTGPGGNFQIKVLGGDNKPFDMSIPYRTIAEQTIARFGMPPFMYGLSWSTTERMASQQLDMLVAEIENDRWALDATIEQTIDMYLILEGMAGAKWRHEWYPVNLQDQAVVSATRLQNAQAFEKEIANQFMLRDAGFVTDDDVLNFLIESGAILEESIKRVGREKILLDAADKYSKKQIEKWAKIIAE